MSLGKRIKTLRAEQQLSQPELAEKIGIEQSYLSKLENDKSVPSNDIFRALLAAFALDIDQFMLGVDASGYQQLQQVPVIDAWLNQQQASQMQHQRLFLYSCSLLLVLGITLFFTGFSKILFSETHYEYESPGVVLPGEPDNVFDNWMRLMTPEDASDRGKRDAMALTMEQRKDERTLLTTDYRGSNFTIVAEDGRRYYRLYKDLQLERPINAWLQVFGVLLISGGAIGFLVERKLYRN